MLSINGDFVPPSVEVAHLASECGAAPPKSRDIAKETKRGVFHDGDHELERTGQSWHQAPGVDWPQLESAAKMPLRRILMVASIKRSSQIEGAKF